MADSHLEVDHTAAVLSKELLLVLRGSARCDYIRWQRLEGL